MWKVCLFYSQNNNDYQTWQTHLFEKFTRRAKVCGLFFLDCAFRTLIGGAGNSDHTLVVTSLCFIWRFTRRGQTQNQLYRYISWLCNLVTASVIRDTLTFQQRQPRGLQPTGTKRLGLSDHCCAGVLLENWDGKKTQGMNTVAEVGLGLIVVIFWWWPAIDLCHSAAPLLKIKHMNKTHHWKEQSKFSKCTNFQSHTPKYRDVPSFWKL